MAIQQMITTLKNNRIQKSDRKTLYDHKGLSRVGNSYQDMDDHKTMKSHVFADFQKEQFKQRKLARKRRLILRMVVVTITFLLIMLFLYAWENDFFSFFDSRWVPTG